MPVIRRVLITESFPETYRGMTYMDELLCRIEINKMETHYRVKLIIRDDPPQEYRSHRFEEAFEQAINELQEEFELNP